MIGHSKAVPVSRQRRGRHQTGLEGAHGINYDECEAARSD